MRTPTPNKDGTPLLTFRVKFRVSKNWILNWCLYQLVYYGEKELVGNFEKKIEVDLRCAGHNSDLYDGETALERAFYGSKNAEKRDQLREKAIEIVRKRYPRFF